MVDLLERASRSINRAREAATMIGRRAADTATRRALMDIYSHLGSTERYGEIFDLKLRLAGRTVPMRIRLGDIFVLGEIMAEGQYRLRSPLRDPAVIVDAGANIGASALWFACQFPDAQLHAFEPEARNFALLSTNLASLPKATCFREAVGRSAGEVALHLGTSEATHSIVDGFPDAESGPVEMVPVTTLAAHMEAQGLRRIDLLKLDVEGAELDALVGLDARIADVRVIVGELHEHVVDATEFYTFLKDAGFRIVARTAFREGNVTGVHGFEAARKF